MGNSKIILVTGSNKGIGLEIVRQLAQHGYRVILTSRDETKGLAAQEKLQQEKLRVEMLVMDITNEQQIQRAVETVKSKFGNLDVLINNAAIALRGDRSLSDAPPEIINPTIETNALAQLRVTQKFLQLVPEGGRIIMVSSGGGSMTDPVEGWSPAYCVSKSLLNAITRQLAFELRGRKISVNAYCPGWVKTDMGGKSATLSVEKGADTAVWLATADNIPTGKFFRNRKEIPW